MRTFRSQRSDRSEMDPNSAALLVEFGAANEEELARKEKQVTDALQSRSASAPGIHRGDRSGRIGLARGYSRHRREKGDG
jgi:hypothetical protein